MTALEVLQNISIIIAAWSVFYGIDSWRREHRGKRQIELAENTLALFYEAFDAIKTLRCPMSSNRETDNVERGENESDAQFEARKNACVVFNRYEQHQELFNKIHATRYRFMAQIGKEESAPFDELRKITNQILGSARSLSRLWAKHHFRSDEKREKHYQNTEKYEAIFWEEYGNDEDPINPQLDQLILDIESTCKKIISGQGTLFGLLNIKLGKKS